MEIEKKFLIRSLNDIPGGIDTYNYHEMEQGYLNTAPVLRVRKEDDNYYFTYKGAGMLKREEYNLPLNKESYESYLEQEDNGLNSDVVDKIVKELNELKINNDEERKKYVIEGIDINFP